AELGWLTRTHRLDAGFPHPSPQSLAEAAEVLAAIPAGRFVVVDGLALAGLLPVLERERARLRLVALIHHLVGDETGWPPDARAQLLRDERRACGAVERIIVTSRWTARRLLGLGES